MRAKQVRECMQVSNQITNVKFYGNYRLKRETEVKLRAINEIMWMIDTEDSENECVKKNMDINMTLLIKRYDILSR